MTIQDTLEKNNYTNELFNFILDYSKEKDADVNKLKRLLNEYKNCLFNYSNASKNISYDSNIKVKDDVQIIYSLASTFVDYDPVKITCYIYFRILKKGYADLTLYFGFTYNKILKINGEITKLRLKGCPIGYQLKKLINLIKK